MTKLVPAVCLALTAALAVATPATPAAAQPSADTNVTFTVAAADLTIEVPAATDLGSAFPGQTITGQLGLVTVHDERAAVSAVWVASVVATQFDTGSDQPVEVVQPELIEYWSGPGTAIIGDGTLVPGQPTRADRQALGQARTAFEKTSGSGINEVAWNPTLEINLSINAVAGLYSGSVTHSVS